MHRKQIFKILGAVGTFACLVVYIREPSFPTPDKILIFATFVSMMFGQGWALFKRLAPFVAVLLAYELFRGQADRLNTHVNYTWMIDADRFLFHSLPTDVLQRWLWHGHVQWFDFMLYLVYMMHFVLPLGLALYIWKTRAKEYWRYVATFVTVSFAGFITFLLFPAAPPWMAAQKVLIPPMTRISSQVWSALGVHDFPSVYNKISPNPVAAVPSLHAAYATLFFIFVYKLYGKKWALLASVYPLCIYFGTVYQGEHYAIDEILGALYAIAAYFAVSYAWKRHQTKK